MIAAVATGLVLGLSCGLAPGPLMALVLAQSLRHGAREGCKIALAPLLTDMPISFHLMLVGSKVALALLAARSREFLAGWPYRFTMRTLGVLLVACAALLFRQAWRHWGAT
jgi:threonine/homoserine/homoserine lactone efflux protein